MEAGYRDLQYNMHTRWKGKVVMVLLLGTGIGMVVLSVILFVVSLIYRSTAGKQILEELKKEYD